MKPVKINVKIRKYKKSDRISIIKLYKEFEGYLTSIDTLKRIAYKKEAANYFLLKNLTDVGKKKGVFYVAEINGKVVGLVVAVIPKPDKEDKLSVHSNRPKTVGEIQELYVASSHRRRNIGRHLMDAAEEYLRKNGCDVFITSVFVPNTGARKFYEKVGYLDRSLNLIKETRK